MNKTYAILMIVKAIGLAGGFLTTELIARKLSAHEQGLFYSYLSLVGFYYIFDCYSQLLLVRVSHYSSQIKVIEKRLAGLVSVEFAGLVKSSFKVIAFQTLFAFFAIGSGGLLLFDQETTSNQIAWWVTCFACAISALTMPFLAVLEGFGFVCEVAWIRLAQSISIHCSSLLALQFGSGVHTLGIGFLAMNFATLFFLAPWHRLFAKILQAEAIYQKQKNIWRDMGKTWLVGCAVVCSGAVPILMLRHFQGEEIAGEYGMTRRMYELILVAGATIFTTRTAKFGMLHAAGDRQGFVCTIRESVSAGLAITLIAVIAVIFGRDVALGMGFRFPERLADDTTIVLLAAATVVACAIWGLEIMIRSAGEEPLWKQNIVRCIACVIGYWLSSKLWGSAGAAAMSLAMLALLVLPWNLILARSFWKNWKQT
jgi:O-antigen/teichoic acid export membrane protein